MAHVQKLKAGQIKGILNHNSRATEHHSNQDIDITKSCMNYNLAAERKSASEVLEIAQEYSNKKLRDNINVACSWVVTLPKDVLPEEQEKFFKASYGFLSKRYGAEDNIISADVHLDETTPHLHFTFIPLAYDQESARWKLSAKDVLTRSELKKFHKDLNIAVARALGREVSILDKSEETKEYTSIKELKRTTEQLEKKLEHLDKQVSEKTSVLADLRAKTLEVDIRELKKENEALKKQNNALNDIIELLKKVIQAILVLFNTNLRELKEEKEIEKESQKRYIYASEVEKKREEEEIKEELKLINKALEVMNDVEIEQTQDLGRGRW